jgi:hypothetical protein
MFNHVSTARKTVPGPDTVYFLDWLNERAFSPEQVRSAQKLFERLVKAASPLGRLKMTPQSPPFHAEGELVVDHVVRILAGLNAFEHGASLAEVEEFAREKDYILELHELESTLKAQAAFLAAYAVCHDVAKADALSFEAAPGSKGDAEGFGSRAPQLATEPEKVRYDKLRRAHHASGSKLSFFEAYGITVHYPEHGRRGASDEYASTREAALDALDVPLSKAKLFTELIRCHMDVIHGFNSGPDPVKYKALAAIAERAGLNAPVFLDLLPATIFLDAVLGSLVYVDKDWRADVHILLNLFKSEREAMPERHAAREEALRRGRKQAVREVLETAKIEAESVFALLKTPYGPVRGEVMDKIHDLIRDPERKSDFGEHTAELRSRARVANKLLQDLHLTID